MSFGGSQKSQGELQSQFIRSYRISCSLIDCYFFENFHYQTLHSIHEIQRSMRGWSYCPNADATQNSHSEGGGSCTVIRRPPLPEPSSLCQISDAPPLTKLPSVPLVHLCQFLSFQPPFHHSQHQSGYSYFDIQKESVCLSVTENEHFLCLVSSFPHVL